MSSPTAVDPQQPLEPLWRGLLVYRVLALVSTAVVVLGSLIEYRSAAGAVAVLVVMTGWTALSGLAYLGPGAPARRAAVAVVDVLVTVAVMASTPFVQTPAQLAADAPVMGSIWTPGAVLAAALCFGVRGGQHRTRRPDGTHHRRVRGQLGRGLHEPVSYTHLTLPTN